MTSISNETANIYIKFSSSSDFKPLELNQSLSSSTHNELAERLTVWKKSSKSLVTSKSSTENQGVRSNYSTQVKRFDRLLKSILKYAEIKKTESNNHTNKQINITRKEIRKKVVHFFKSFEKNLNPELLQSTIDKVSEIYDQFKRQTFTGRNPQSFACFIQNRCAQFPLTSALIQSESPSSSFSSFQSNGTRLSSSSNPIPEDSIALFNHELTKILSYAQEREELELLDGSKITTTRLNGIRKTIKQNILSFFCLFKKNLNPKLLQKTMTKVGTIYDEITKIKAAKGLPNSTDFVDFLFEHALSLPLMRDVTYKEFIGPNLPAPNEAPPNPKKPKTRIANAAQEVTGTSIGMTTIESEDDGDVAMPAASSSSNAIPEAANPSAASQRKRKEPAESSTDQLAASSSLTVNQS